LPAPAVDSGLAIRIADRARWGNGEVEAVFSLRESDRPDLADIGQMLEAMRKGCRGSEAVKLRCFAGR
jgi:hypothetical protein